MKKIPHRTFIPLCLLLLFSGCKSLPPALPDLSGYPVISSPAPQAEKGDPFSIQMKTVLRFKKESFSMIQILSADPGKGFYHCQMLSPFGVKCLEFTRQSGNLQCDYIFPAMKKLNKNNRLVLLLSESLDKIFRSGEMEKAIFYKTPELILGTLTCGQETLHIKTDPDSGQILEKNYFIRGKNVVNISFLNNSLSREYPFSGTIRYSHLKSGLTMDLKRIPSEHDQ